MGSFTPPPTTSLAPGDRLDRYELLCVLAQGGMGTVWLARLQGKLGFERLVALKTILPSYTNDRQFCDMFLDEARIAASIDHENVARILEIGEDRGVLFYAMELIEGESLRKLYRDVRAQGAMLPLGVCLRIAADACAGMHATHELHGPDGMPLDVVHRDVSPQNLLITIRGTTKLIDFGVAKARARRSEETAAGTLKGKIEFMAPEQARGEPLDRRADIYSIGAVLYELVAGRAVRDTEDGKQLAALHEVLTGVPVQPLPPYVPDIVRQIIERALAQDPRYRFGTADELRRALEQAMLAIGQTATTDDVARALEHYSRERTAKRRDVIDRALRAATEGRLAAATIVAPMGHVLPPDPRGVPQPYPSSRGEPVTGPSLRTMQGASYTQPPAPRSTGKVFAVILALVLVGGLGVGAGVVVTKRGGLKLGKVPAVVARPTPPPQASDSTGAPPPTPPPVVTGEPSGPASGVASAAASSSARPSASASARSKTVSSPQPTTPRGPQRIGPKPNSDPSPDEYGF